MTLRVTSRRVLVAACGLFLTMVVLLSRCGLSHLEEGQSKLLVVPEVYEKRYISLEKHKLEITAMKERIVSLEAQLVKNVGESKDFYDNEYDEKGDSTLHPDPSATRNDDAGLLKFISDTVKSSEITRGIEHSTEYDLIPADRFTLSRIYLAHPGLGKRVVEKPIGYKRRELNEVLTKALDLLNKNATMLYGAHHFLEGIYRTEPKLGTHYELFFINPSDPNNFKKLIFTRPFAPLQVVLGGKQERQTPINLIMPLSGRYSTFVKFMSYFVKTCIKSDQNVHLTVVYFGSDGLSKVKNLLHTVEKEHKYHRIKLLTLNETFSRGRGLQYGAEKWRGDEVLLFLCDVDIVFTTEYLRRCRLHAELGTKVYYPVVFSLYNPKSVYSLLNTGIPHTDKQLVISKSTGFWRDFGYGMTCQYRSDFLRVGGFPKVTGWGMEDVLLYRKYVKSKYMVVRAPDPGIFHTWHEKVCDKKLTPDQYKGCIQSKALNEAPHEFLGVLAFKEEFEYYKTMKKTKPTKKAHH